MRTLLAAPSIGRNIREFEELPADMAGGAAGSGFDARIGPAPRQDGRDSVARISLVAQKLRADERVGVSTDHRAALNCGEDRRSTWRDRCNHFNKPRTDRDPTVVRISDFGASPGGRHHRGAW